MMISEAILAASPKGSAAGDELEVRSGQTLQATVVPAPDGQNSPLKVGLKVGSVVIPAQTSEALEIGTQVELKVVHAESPLIFKIIPKESESAPLVRPTSSDSISRILSDLDISKPEIEALRKLLLAGSSEPIKINAQKVPLDLLLTEEDLGRPELLARELTRLSLPPSTKISFEKLARAEQANPSLLESLGKLNRSLDQALKTAVPELSAIRDQEQISIAADRLLELLSQETAPLGAKLAQAVRALKTEIDQINISQPQAGSAERIAHLSEGLSEALEDAPDEYHTVSSQSQETIKKLLGNVAQFAKTIALLGPKADQDLPIQNFLKELRLDNAPEVKTQLTELVRLQLGHLKDAEKILVRIENLEDSSGPLAEVRKIAAELDRHIRRSPNLEAGLTEVRGAIEDLLNTDSSSLDHTLNKLEKALVEAKTDQVEPKGLIKTLEIQVQTLKTLPRSALSAELTEGQLEKDGLLPALREIGGGQPSQHPTSTAELRRFINNQLLALNDIAETLPKLLDTQNNSDKTDQLRQTLERALEQANLGSGKLSGESLKLALSFKDFILDLKTKLDVALKLETPIEKIREILVEALDQLHQEFGEQSSSISLERFVPRKELPRNQAIFLKLVEAEISVLVANLDDDEKPLPASVLKPLKEILNHEPGDAAGVKDTLQAIIRRSEITKFVSPEDRKLLAKTLDLIHAEFGAKVSPAQALAQTIAESLATTLSATTNDTKRSAPEAGFELKNKLTKAIQEIPKTLLAESAIKDLVELLDLSKQDAEHSASAVFKTLESVFSLKGSKPEVATAIDKFLKQIQEISGTAKDLSDPVLKKIAVLTQALKAGEQSLSLITSLSRFEQIVSSPTSFAETQIGELLGSLEQSLKSPGFDQQRALLRNAQTVLRTQNHSLQAQQSKTEQADQNLQALAGAETILRGQEALAKLAPLMQVAGEPALMLFPAIFGGFLSQVELTLYPAPKTDPDAAKKNASGPDSHGYYRATMRCTLPGLGQAEASLAHRKKELKLEFKFENPLATQFIKGKLPALRQILEQRGYETIDAEVSTKRLSNSKPAWVSAIARSSKAVA